MAGDPQETLAVELQRLRRSFGSPSTRTIAKATGYSHTMIAQALNGKRCPKWPAIEEMVRYLGGDVEMFLTLWRAVEDAKRPLPVAQERTQATDEPDSAVLDPARTSARQRAATQGAGEARRVTAYPPPDDWFGSAVPLRFRQPMLFVGLGGSGCELGAALERCLRKELCGPDGEELTQSSSPGRNLPYQLPACVQFLYADLSQQQLDRMARRVVPGSAYIPAALQTAHYSHYLAPRVEISTYLSRNLRLRIPQELIRWLPSADNEPAVSPLASGAGQIPTVGRAALFSAVADDGLGPAVRDLNLAIGRLARSGEDLCRLGGTIVRSVIVLVAFSVVGGTGAGIFYDYLHLIGHTFGETRLRARIYPLVLMPSAFPEGLGGGRYANLNAAPALRDLFRLIDEQNAPQFEWNLRLSEPDADDLVVRYPGEGWVRMRPGMAQTGILFTQPPGTDRNDLYRSICSLMVALIGVGSEADPGDSATGDPGEPSDDWVNAGSFRRHPADDGIGNRGVSTALVAALKSPSAEIADIISDRLLREAVRQLSSPDAATESDQEYAEAFLAAAGPADDIVPFDEPEPAQGAREVAAALRARSQAMLDGLRTLRSGDYGKVPDPGAAVDGMLAKLDVFRVHRVMVSGADLEGAADRAGADGPRRDQMIVPADLSAIPPKVPEFTDRSSRRKLRWSDPEPTAIRQRQDAWYQ